MMRRTVEWVPSQPIRMSPVASVRSVNLARTLPLMVSAGVAAAVLEKLGIRADAARAGARELFPGGGHPGEQPPPDSAEAREAVQGAAGLARRAGHGYVGTEHLLCVLALDPGSRARRVLGQLGVSIPAIK